ncbi:hypothetical protein FOXB_17205 [Fusarium oxysporum f. sp. conglutinans Fo5176]|uniref:Uncharacterized protein n=1 Tax=Fusarium oxysporum (strain Fo5176) TaxID=660025 RepID=F9GEX1_FUSOF|nr:hypothetical protein FOXB_17205 [Fusarium oxysporum f. sp. conglutinans Fo5176]
MTSIRPKHLPTGSLVFNFTAALTTSNDTVLLVVQLFRAIDTGCLTVTGRAVIAGPWGMDDSNRMRRQNEPPAHSNPNQRYSLNDTSRQRRSLAENSNNRYRPASLAGPSSSGRAYGSEYGHDSRRTQGFGGYSTAATMMYNVGPPSTQNKVHDAQQFSSRQPAAMQMMPPDITSSYFGSKAGTSAGPSLQQPAQGSSGSANLALVSGCKSRGEQKKARADYCACSGLNLDDTNLHADRIQLWNDFNHAWLGLGQRQIVLMTSPQQLSSTQSLVSKAMIKKMGNELIRLCDGIERHGLVDYQYGVWEDQITAVLEDCLDLYDASEEGSVCGNW